MSTSQKAQKYLYAAHAGVLVLVAVALTEIFGAPDFLRGLFVGMLLPIVILLFSSSLRDEFVERLWNAGTAAAFLATIAATLGVELVRGFLDQGEEVFAQPAMFDSASIGLIALSAFFVGFHFKLLRSRG